MKKEITNEETLERQGRLNEYSLGMVNGYMMSKDLELEVIGGLEECIYDGSSNTVFDAGFGLVEYTHQLDFDEEEGVDIIYTDMHICVYNDNGRDYELVKCYRFVSGDDFWDWVPGYLSGEFFRACLALEYQEEICEN